MLGRRVLEEIGKKISDMVATSPAKDIEKNIKAVLTSALARLDVVTREEFNLQQEICVQTRESLNEITVRLDRLEAKLSQNKILHVSSSTQTKRKRKVLHQVPVGKLTKSGRTTKSTRILKSRSIPKP
ncbi:MAG: accessory factor UbiK family protein [Neisseriales bacterium]|nr:MAG: accessory factor UbiK family protein [Neisseriales bacterium]